MKSSNLKTSLSKTWETIQRNRSDVPALKKIINSTFDKGVSYLGQQMKYNLYKVTHPKAFQRQKDFIYVIYTMGKVGSTTLYSTFFEKIPHENLYHVHFLSPAGMKKREEFSGDPGITADDRKILQYIESHPEKKLKIITLVREPVGRDISDLFQSLHIYYPGKTVPEITEEDLKNTLLTNNFQHTLHWLDEEFKAYLQFDVYQTPFDKEKGYQIYQQGNTDILLIRLEDLSKCYQQALYEFTGIYFEELINTNLTDDKESAELNKKFKKNFRLEKAVLEELYASRYVRHFYTEKEIASFIRKYSA